MNKIAGFYSLEQDLSEKKSDSENLLKKMKEVQQGKRGGPKGRIRISQQPLRPDPHRQTFCPAKGRRGCMRAVQRRNLQLERALQRAV